ncbi:hypothetical protein LNV23_19015 [Paucibacter sp. DJ1R-11]|uniref:hypothetical protein n=1 Tax=Paucibacter sp. DJ1R-11 TaxID=2893556 RepID=UPI0021E410EB|nr:hypothetical protein [Paucibacter sp. DJ1R-11]MCV2365545.1 hypothetical protein [Paucibacter sp. DJ1R-11]
MKRPSFQFYPGDWRKNAKLRRCSDAARGAWIDVMCILHDSSDEAGEYGVVRWPLEDLARAAGAQLKLCKELASKGVLKGADKGAAPYVHTPRHAGKVGEPVVLVDTAGGGPVWYCSRMVRDEWMRQRRGASTRFSPDFQPPGRSPKGGIGEPYGDGSEGGREYGSEHGNNPPIRVPTGRQGNGPSSSSSSLIQTDNLTQAEVSCVDGLEPTQLGAVYAALRDAGVTDANPGDPVLKVMVEQGVDVAEWRAAAKAALKAGRSDMAYVVGVVRNKRADASKLKLAPAAQPVHTVTVASNDAEITRQRLEAEAKRPFGLPSEEQRAKIAEARQAARLTPVVRAQA